MGSIVKRGTSVRAVVRKGGQVLTKSFPTTKEAKIWIGQQEHRIVERNVHGGGLSLAQIIAQYRDEVIAKKKYDTSAAQGALSRFEAHFAGVDLVDMNEKWWIDSISGFDVEPGTRCRYMTYITCALRTADALWGAKPDWDAYRTARRKMSGQGIIGLSNERDRRLESGELDAIKAAIFSRKPIGDVIDFAIATAMRVGEICRLEWADVNELKKTILIRQRKDPKKKLTNNQVIPLLGESLAIIRRQPKDGKYIFPFKPQIISKAFDAAKETAGIEGLVFHDLRHEGISRLFEQGYSIPEVALMSGHKSWKMLQRYTKLNPADLHKGPLAHRSQRAA